MTYEPKHPARDAWKAAFIKLVLPIPPVAPLMVAYAENHRHYHTERHVDHVVKTLNRFMGRHSGSLGAHHWLAAWFHDAIYDPKRSDNEEKSAEWAAEFLKEAKVPCPVINRVENMIMETKSHKPAKQDDAVFCDADLAVLAISPGGYWQYAHNVRQEYDFLTDEQWNAGRKKVLEGFLDREFIFTSLFGKDMNVAAWRNLRMELETL